MKRVITLITCCGVCVPLTWANAQDSDNSLLFLERIEVTAQKRVQSIQEIPISLTAITPEELNTLQLTRADEIASIVPSLHSTRSISGVNNYFIRGVGMDDFNLSSVASVGLYLDDVAINNPMLSGFSLFDVERIEVLRGPQNTLFGKNTTGGAINFISVSPQSEQQGFVQLTLASDDQVNVDGAIRLVANDDLKFRLSGFSHQKDGTVTSKIEGNNTEYNDEDRYGLRGQMHYQLLDNLAIIASVYGGQQKQITEVKTPIYAEEGQHINLDDFDLSKNYSSLINPPNDIDSLGGYLKLSWQLPTFLFSSISSFEQVKSKRMDDWGGQHLPSGVYQSITYNSTDTKYYTQEFQLVSAIGGDFDWLIGVAFNKDKGDLLQAAYIDPAGPGRPDDAIEDAGIGPLFDRASWVENDSTTMSAYAQISYSLSQKWLITGGYRWTQQQLEPTVNSAGMMMDLPGQEFPLGSLGWYSLGNPNFDIFRDHAGFDALTNFKQAYGDFPASANVDKTFTEWGGKVALDYQLNDSVLLYSSVSRGFKMGAVNSNPTSVAFTGLLERIVAPETLTTYELGWKADLLDNSLRINGAIFKNYWDDYQFFLVANPGPPSQLFASLVNLPEATTHGAEIELSWQADHDLYIKLGASWLETEVKNGQLDSTGIPPETVAVFQSQVKSGNELTNAPKWSLSAIAQKSYYFTQSEINLTAHYQFIDEHIHQLAGENSDVWQKNFSENSVGLLNFTGQYLFGEDKDYAISVWVTNATDELFCSERSIAPGTSPETVRLCAQSQDRQIGVTAKAIF